MADFFLKIIVLILLMTTFNACDNPPQMPKPSTYMRLEIVPSEYVLFDNSDYPFKFEYPSNAEIEFLKSGGNNTRWLNLNFEKYHFKANISYLKLSSEKDLQKFVNDCYTFLKRHEKLSGGIIEQEYSNPEKHLYGTVFEIKGRDVVSPFQFYLTDSVGFAVRIALNNEQIPNNDSLSAVITSLKTDMIHLINTFEWK